MSGRGAILLEMLFALAIFVVTGLTIATALDGAHASLVRSRDAARAADLARSAMAQLESQLASVEVLDGPVRGWSDEAENWRGDPLVDAGGERIAFDERGGGPSDWRLRIESEPSEFEGLSVVRVTAERVDPVSGGVVTSRTLRGLLELREARPDEVGEAGELVEAAEQGAARAQRRGGGR